MNRDKRERLDSQRKRVKGNPAQLKELYVTRKWTWAVWDGVERTSWCDTIPMFRCPRTMQEKRMNAAHEDEYSEYIRIRGNRQGYSLPDSWTDLGVSAYHSRRSWKTNSKRRKQYKSRHPE